MRKEKKELNIQIGKRVHIRFGRFIVGINNQNFFGGGEY